jgi:hypothetical protein
MNNCKIPILTLHFNEYSLYFFISYSYPWAEGGFMKEPKWKEQFRQYKIQYGNTVVTDSPFYYHQYYYNLLVILKKTLHY